ncbi:unnamed protein product, partial [Brenthis ino]
MVNYISCKSKNFNKKYGKSNEGYNLVLRSLVYCINWFKEQQSKIWGCVFRLTVESVMIALPLVAWHLELCAKNLKIIINKDGVQYILSSVLLLLCSVLLLRLLLRPPASYYRC